MTILLGRREAYTCPLAIRQPIFIGLPGRRVLSFVVSPSVSDHIADQPSIRGNRAELLAERRAQVGLWRVVPVHRETTTWGLNTAVDRNRGSSGEAPLAGLMKKSSEPVRLLEKAIRLTSGDQYAL